MDILWDSAILNLGIKTRLTYERFRGKSEI